VEKAVGLHVVVNFTGSISVGLSVSSSVRVYPSPTISTNGETHATQSVVAIGRTDRRKEMARCLLGQDNKASIPPDSRAQSVRHVHVGSTSRHAYDVLGPPDYIMTAEEEDQDRGDAHWWKKWIDAWRYDFGRPHDYSLLLIWDDEGRVRRIERVTPGLWLGDRLFSDQMPRPIFWADGDLNGIHLDSPHFTGKIDVIGG